MKVTSRQALEALRQARGDRSWSQFAATAPRDIDGVILVKRVAESAPTRAGAATKAK